MESANICPIKIGLQNVVPYHIYNTIVSGVLAQKLKTIQEHEWFHLSGKWRNAQMLHHILRTKGAQALAASITCAASIHG